MPRPQLIARKKTVGQTLIPSRNDMGSPRPRSVRRSATKDQEADRPSPTNTITPSRRTSQPRRGRRVRYQESGNNASRGKQNLRNRPEVISAVPSRIATRKPVGITDPDLNWRKRCVAVGSIEE